MGRRWSLNEAKCVSFASMTLTREQFNEQSIEFVKLCQLYGDTWCLMTRLENGQFKELLAREPGACDRSLDEFILTKTELQNSSEKDRVWSYEYSVMYSQSYEVPVMYFCVSDQGGCPVPAEQIVSLESKDLSKVVSQVEHPLLFRPFYMIHPCRTEDFMKIHHSENKNGYLISWLSVVATLINLKLDYRFSLNCQT